MTWQSTRDCSAAKFVDLVGGDWQVRVRPAVGGSIGRFDWSDGTPVFHPAGDGVDGGGCFPLIPFGNRIRDRRFTFAGTEFHLDPNLPEGRVIHGFGWQAAWTVADATDSTLCMTHDHPGDRGWPWRYSAEQRIAVLDDGLHVALHLTNRAVDPMPAGLGLHPFFPALPGQWLGLLAKCAAAVGDDGFPAPLASEATTLAALAAGLAMPANTYVSGVTGPIRLAAAGSGVVVTSSANMRELVVHLPSSGRCLCLEPMTHRVGAFADELPERPGCMLTLAGGATLTGGVHFAPFRMQR